MKNELIVPISPDPGTGLARQATLEVCNIRSGGLALQIRIQFLAADGSLKLDAIAADNSMSDYQKQVASQQFADRVVTRQTTGTFVVPSTGEIVPEETPGSISQNEFFRSLKPADIIAMGLPNQNPTLGELIDAVITAEILKSDARKEI